jgi:hypothetical protein
MPENNLRCETNQMLFYIASRIDQKQKPYFKPDTIAADSIPIRNIL